MSDLSEKLKRATAAKELRDSEAFQSFMTAMERDIAEQWIASTKPEKDTELGETRRGLAAIKRKLDAVASELPMIERDIETARAKDEKAKAARRSKATKG